MPRNSTISNKQAARRGFSARLARACDVAGLPPKYRGRQAAIAETFGVSSTAARKWLEGEAIPTTARIHAIARRLGVGADWLLTGAPEHGVTLTREARAVAERYQRLPEAARQAIRALVEAWPGPE